MTQQSDERILAYRDALRSRLQRLIPGSLFRIVTAAPVAAVRAQKGGRLGGLREAVERPRGQPLVVVGDPGCGKTTILAHLVLSELRRRRFCAMLPMGLYTPGASIEALLGLGVMDPLSMSQQLSEGAALVVFDGIDEARGEPVGLVFQRLLAFANLYPGNRYVMSCRTGELPPWVSADVEQLTVLPVDEGEVDHQFERLDRQRGMLRSVDSQDFIQSRLRELCTNALLLRMALSVYDARGVQGLQGIGSRASLYMHFLDRLSRREDEKGPDYAGGQPFGAGFREEILAYIALRLHETRSIYVASATLQQWLADELASGRWDKWWSTGSRPSTQSVFAHIVNRPPLTSVVRNLGESPQVTFLHPNFIDLYAAYQWSIRAKSGSLSEVVRTLVQGTDSGEWEVTRLLCGLVATPETVTRTVVRVAREGKRQDLLTLAADCIRDCWTMPTEEADDVRLRVLDAFKYWDVPFDYQLIRAGRGTLGRSGRDFPARIATDFQRYMRMYADVLPTELDATPTRELIRLLQSREDAIVVNAAYTLGIRGSSSHADQYVIGAALMQALSSVRGTARVQVLVALKELALPHSLNLLLQIIDDSAEGADVKPHALIGIALIGNLSAVPAVVRYLRDESRPYRDSAAWSLMWLGRTAIRSDPATHHLILESLVDTLAKGQIADDARYVKGAIIYALGMLGAREHVKAIMLIAAGTSEPYLVEDVVNTVGLLDGPGASDFVVGYADHEDPMVRLKVAEAIGRLMEPSAADVAEHLSHDRFRIVRDAAEESLVALRRRTSSEWQRLSNSLADPLRRQQDGVIVRVTDELKPVLMELVTQLRQDSVIRVGAHFTQVHVGWEVHFTMDTYAIVLKACRDRC